MGELATRLPNTKKTRRSWVLESQRPRKFFSPTKKTHLCRHFVPPLSPRINTKDEYIHFGEQPEKGKKESTTTNSTNIPQQRAGFPQLVAHEEATYQGTINKYHPAWFHPPRTGGAADKPGGISIPLLTGRRIRASIRLPVSVHREESRRGISGRGSSRERVYLGAVGERLGLADWLPLAYPGEVPGLSLPSNRANRCSPRSRGEVYP